MLMLSTALALALMPSPDDYAAFPPQLHSEIKPQSGTCVAQPSLTSAPCAPTLVYVPHPVATVHPSLFVYIPGSGNEPRDHDLMLQTAAYAGYRSIGISYDNVDTIGSVCGGFQTDILEDEIALPLPCALECPGKVREERLLGVDASDFDDVFWADALIPRLWRVLNVLHTENPGEGWDTYFNPNKTTPIPRPIDINWDTIVLAGFSQGAGHALRIAQTHQVDGVVLSDGGSDTCMTAAGDEVAANWYIPGGGASSGEPHYAGFHWRGGEFHVPPGLEVVGFEQGDSVDSSFWSLGDYEVFTTDQIWPFDGCSAHKSLAVDHCLPRSSLTPLAPLAPPGSRSAAVTPSEMHLWEPYLEAFWLAGQ